MRDRGLGVALFVILFTVAFASIARAQATDIGGTLGASYSILHVKDDGDAKSTSPVGWVFTLTHNLSRNVAIVGDVDGHYRFKQDYDGFDYQVHSFAGGVRAGAGSGAARPWGQVVAGIARLAFTAVDAAETDFLVSFGGGVDIDLQGPCLARAQVDFPYTRSSETGFGTTRGYRVSFGVAFEIKR